MREKKDKFFKRLKGIDNHPQLQLEVEDTNRMTVITIKGWGYPTTQFSKETDIASSIKKLNKLIRIELWNTLLQQDFFIDKLYLTDLHFPSSTIFINQRAYLSLEVCVYRRETSNAPVCVNSVNLISTNLIDRITNSTCFTFTRNKEDIDTLIN